MRKRVRNQIWRLRQAGGVVFYESLSSVKHRIVSPLIGEMIERKRIAARGVAEEE
ncbi:MAG: hypothetical protein ACKESB_00995 [Candidatus Hodgkinia cicadicola]